MKPFRSGASLIDCSTLSAMRCIALSRPSPVTAETGMPPVSTTVADTSMRSALLMRTTLGLRASSEEYREISASRVESCPAGVTIWVGSRTMTRTRALSV
jgi:hypothetical protein